MSMIVDIRKYSLDNILVHLIEASVVKKKWFRKSIDRYWDYLDANSTQIHSELNSHIIVDLLAYLSEEKKIKFGFEADSNQISINRGTGVLILHPTDIEKMKSTFSDANFTESFEQYAKELNGEFFDYSMTEIDGTIKEFLAAISFEEPNVCLILNIG